MWPLDGAMYITQWKNGGGGHPKNVSLMQFSQNIDGLGQNNSPVL